jgi:site-specific recombinase XerD
MERLPVSSFLPKLSFLGPASQEQVLSYLTLLYSRNYARGTLESVTVNLKRLTLHLSAPRRAVLTHDLAHTTAQDITDFVHRAQAAGLAPSTINLTLSFLTEFFDFLCEGGQMQLQPVSRHRHRLLAPSTLPKPIADSDLAAFFKVIDAVRDRLIFLLMLRCGLRVSEVCALTWSAIDFDGLTIRINNSKGQVDRVAYIAPDIEKALKLWHACSTTGDYLFPGRKQQPAPLSRIQINNLMNKYLRYARLPKHYSPHCLRHTFATQLLNAGVALEVLKELMGHRSIQMTLRYTQLYESTKRRQYDEAMARIEQRQVGSGR